MIKRKKRESMSEINMIPFIDVMLVLLIIFMVTAPMLTPGIINVPSVGKSTKPPLNNIAHIFLDKNGEIKFKDKNQENIIQLSNLGNFAINWQNQQEENEKSEPAIVIYGDKTLPYENIIQVMNELQNVNIKRIALSVNSKSK